MLFSISIIGIVSNITNKNAKAKTNHLTTSLLNLYINNKINPIVNDIKILLITKIPTNLNCLIFLIKFIENNSFVGIKGIVIITSAQNIQAIIM